MVGVRFLLDSCDMSRARNLRALVAALCLSMPLASAMAGDVVLDNLSVQEDKGLLRIARVEAINTNFSSDELRRLLDTNADSKASLELLARFKADRMSINGATFAGEDGTMIFAPILATGIHQGRVDQLAIDGIDIELKNIDGAGSGSVKLRALSVEKADMAPLIDALIQGKPDLINYKAESLKFAGFDISIPDTSLPANTPGGNRIRITLGALNSRAQYNGDMIQSSAGEILNLVIEPPAGSEAGQMLSKVGYKKLDLSMAGAARYDASSRTLTLTDYTLTGVEAGRLSLTGTFGNVDPSLLGMGLPEEKLAALFLVNVSQLELRFVNEGVVDKGFAFAAAQQGKTAPALRSEASMIVGQMLPLLLGGDPSALPLARGVQDFLKESRNFTLTLKARGAPLPLGRLSAIGDPSTFFALVDVQLKSNQ